MRRIFPWFLLAACADGYFALLLKKAAGVGGPREPVAPVVPDRTGAARLCECPPAWALTSPSLLLYFAEPGRPAPVLRRRRMLGCNGVHAFRSRKAQGQGGAIRLGEMKEQERS
jgi:hypothetical protein